MKLFIYCARDKKLGAYQVPEYKTEDPEHIAEGTARSLAVVQGETIEKEYSPWEDNYFYDEHNNVVDYWFMSDMNHLHIKIK